MGARRFDMIPESLKASRECLALFVKSLQTTLIHANDEQKVVPLKKADNVIDINSYRTAQKQVA